MKAGKDPFAGRTGDFKRHYFFQVAGEIMPYRVYVPSSYKGDRSYPLLIALHGNGLTENYFFDNLAGGLQKLAEERGYIVAAPLGYRVDGGYGYNNGSRPAEDAPKLQLSEKDVMHVLELMKKDYRIDNSRIYVAGHSMGGSGSWYLGPKYSQIWAGLGTIFRTGALRHANFRDGDQIIAECYAAGSRIIPRSTNRRKSWRQIQASVAA